MLSLTVYNLDRYLYAMATLGVQTKEIVVQTTKIVVFTDVRGVLQYVHLISLKTAHKLVPGR